MAGYRRSTSSAGSLSMWKNARLITLILVIGVSGCNEFEWPDFKPSIESVVAKWGTGSAEHDKYFLEVLVNSGNPDCAYDYSMDSRFLDAILKRFREKPELLQLVGQENLKRLSPPCDNSDWFIVRYVDHMEDAAPVGVCVNLIMFASLFDRPEWIRDQHWDDVYPRWEVMMKWLKANMHYVVYDHDRKVFVVDELARERGEPVARTRQSWVKCDGS